MRRTNVFKIGVGLFLISIFFQGCTTMRIAMNPTVPSELAGRRIPVKVALYMDTDFQNYHFQDTSGMELSKLDFNLGAASKNLFLETFMHMTEGVVLVDKKPPYAPDENIDAAIVVEPHIAGFSYHEPFGLRIGTYKAKIKYRTIVYDRMGKVLLDKTYEAEGAAKGHATQSPASNYAAPAEIAMGKAITLLIGDIDRLELPKE